MARKIEAPLKERLAGLLAHPYSHLNYGETKAGKTRMSIQAVRELGGLAIDTEGRWSALGLPAAPLDLVAAEARSKTPDWLNLRAMLSGAVVYLHTDDYELAFRLALLLSAARKALGEPLVPLIVFDGWTEFQSKAITAIGRQTQGTKLGTDDARLLSRQGWGLLYRDQIMLQDALAPTETGSLLYATANIAEKNDPLDPAVAYLAPDLSGQFGAKIKKHYDVITYMRKVKPEQAGGHIIRRLYFQAVGNFIAGHIWEHLDVLPDSLDNPDLCGIMEQLASAAVWNQR